MISTSISNFVSSVLTSAFVLMFRLRGHWVPGVHDHGQGDEAEGEDGVEVERDAEHRHAQHSRHRQLQCAGKRFQYRVQLLEKQTCHDPKDRVVNYKQQHQRLSDGV